MNQHDGLEALVNVGSLDQARERRQTWFRSRAAAAAGPDQIIGDQRTGSPCGRPGWCRFLSSELEVSGPSATLIEKLNSSS